MKQLFKEYVLNSRDKSIVDQKSIIDHCIPSLISIENAAISIFNSIEKYLKNNQRVIVVAGPGNNGADGLALARILFVKGYDIYINCNNKRLSKDANVQLEILNSLNIPFVEIDQINCNDIVIDALFGSGIKGEIDKEYHHIIDCINNSGSFVIGIDMPSGINASSNILPRHYVHNNLTIFIDSYPLSLFKYPSRNSYKDYILVDINFPQELKKDLKDKIRIINFDLASSCLVKRNDEANKGTYKKALLIGGSDQMAGAIYLAGKACLHSGVGTLTLFIPDCINAIENRIPEAMYISAPSDNGYFNDEAIKKLQNIINNYDVIAIGNGMGRNKVNEELLKTVLNTDKTTIVDADAIYNLRKQKDLLVRKAETIITPHLKEFSYLNNIEVEKIKEDPFTYLDDFVKKYSNCTVVLKSSFTIIKNCTETYLLNKPNSALSKGGSGDVLCGIILGLIANLDDTVKAAIASTFIHNYAIDDNYNARCFSPELLIDGLNSAFNKLEEKDVTD